MIDHIRIGNILPRVQYVGDGVQTDFTFRFPIFSPNDLEVYIDESRQSAGFTVEGAGSSDGGTVIFTTPPAGSVLVTLRRHVTIQRISDFQPSGEFRAQVINDELDYQTAALQDLAASVERAIRLAPTSADADLTLPDVPAGEVRYLRLNGTTRALETGGSGPTGAFTDLSDAPASYAGNAQKVLTVKATEDGIAFADMPAGQVGAFVDLTDVPSEYSGQASKVLAVKGTEDGIEFAPIGAISLDIADFTPAGNVDPTGDALPIYSNADGGNRKVTPRGLVEGAVGGPLTIRHPYGPYDGILHLETAAGTDDRLIDINVTRGDGDTVGADAIYAEVTFNGAGAASPPHVASVEDLRWTVNMNEPGRPYLGRPIARQVVGFVDVLPGGTQTEPVGDGITMKAGPNHGQSTVARNHIVRDCEYVGQVMTNQADPATVSRARTSLIVEQSTTDSPRAFADDDDAEGDKDFCFKLSPSGGGEVRNVIQFEAQANNRSDAWGGYLVSGSGTSLVMPAESTLMTGANAYAGMWVLPYTGPGYQRTLNYDGGTVAFAAGRTVTGSTSGATAVIHGVSGTAAAGTLSLHTIDGDFEDGEAITDTAGGAAVANGVLGAVTVNEQPRVTASSHDAGTGRVTLTVTPAVSGDWTNARVSVHSIGGSAMARNILEIAEDLANPRAGALIHNRSDSWSFHRMAASYNGPVFDFSEADLLPDADGQNQFVRLKDDLGIVKAAGPSLKFDLISERDQTGNIVVHRAISKNMTGAVKTMAQWAYEVTNAAAGAETCQVVLTVRDADTFDSPCFFTGTTIQPYASNLRSLGVSGNAWQKLFCLTQMPQLGVDTSRDLTLTDLGRTLTATAARTLTMQATSFPSDVGFIYLTPSSGSITIAAGGGITVTGAGTISAGQVGLLVVKSSTEASLLNLSTGSSGEPPLHRISAGSPTFLASSVNVIVAGAANTGTLPGLSGYSRILVHNKTSGSFTVSRTGADTMIGADGTTGLTSLAIAPGDSRAFIGDPAVEAGVWQVL